MVQQIAATENECLAFVSPENSISTSLFKKLGFGVIDRGSTLRNLPTDHYNAFDYTWVDDTE